jgi:tyrosyl-DNA phosphodiesterase-1
MIFRIASQNQAILRFRRSKNVLSSLLGILKPYTRMADAADEPSRKKRRLGEQREGNQVYGLTFCFPDSSVSPPPLRRKMQVRDSPPKVMKSPFQLTRITDLPPASNVDTISLKDILGDPLISECWEFNYLHNLDFLMDAFDEDVRDLVKVHVIHGFWKQEDPGRLNLLVSDLVVLYVTTA